MRAFGVSEDFVRTKISSAKGWIYYNFAKETEMTMLGAAWQMKGRGFIGQERIKILAKQKS
jgi:hypothetical protein